jgi:hypothetical protein
MKQNYHFCDPFASPTTTRVVIKILNVDGGNRAGLSLKMRLSDN